MKLNSPSVIIIRLIGLGKALLGIVAVLCTCVVALAAVHVLARGVYASLGYFANQFPLGCRSYAWQRCTDPDIPWMSFHFKWDWFVRYTDEPKAMALSHLTALVVVFVLSMLIYGLWVLLFKPLAPQSVDKHYDGFSCKDELCACDNHHRSRTECFIEGEWAWQASCRNPECPCKEHEGDMDGDTYAPELQDLPSFNV